MNEEVQARLDRLESLEEIRQLVSKYALAIDCRDLDALVHLFVDDVQVGRDRHGRSALKEWYDDLLRHRFGQTAHLVANHIIEFDGIDRAHGVVYCRAEHEMGERFVIVLLQYYDDYERHDGRWLFRRHRPLYWYACDVTERPVGGRRLRWPDGDPADGDLPEWWPSWREFWEQASPTPGPLREPSRPGEFLTGLRRRQGRAL